MDPHTWSRLRPILEAALARPGPEREAFVREQAGADEGLAAWALGLLRDEETAGGLLEDETPLFGGAAARAGIPAPGARLGSWRLERELGRGGMGAVWLARRADAAFDQRVALKLVRTGLDGDEVLRRFGREQRLLAGLEHPGIARLIDAGSDEAGRPFLVMEHVDGRPIDAWCRERALPLRARLRLFVRVCEAVEHAHRRLVVHRDLKPSNVLVTAEGQPKLLDFGIAKVLDPAEAGEATLTGQQAYTPHYASPEQVRGEQVGTQTDVYSLGVLLYELLAGQRPYRLETGSPTETLRVVGEVDPRPPSAAALADEGALPGERARWSRALAGDLDAIVLTALRKEPERRYGSVEALAADLRRYLDGLPVSARPDTLGYRARKFLRRHGVPVAVATALLAALLAGLAGTTTQYLRAERARRDETEQNRLAGARLVELQRLSADLEAERAAAVERADELGRLSRELGLEKALAERRFDEVRRFATTLIFDVQRSLWPVPGATQARELLVRLGLEHLDRLAAEAGEDDALKVELSGAYVQMGNVLGQPIGPNLGRTAEAAEAYRKALALARSVESSELPRLRGFPLVCEAGHALSDALAVLGRTEEARAVLEGVLADVAALVDGAPSSTADVVAVLSTLGRLARFEMDAGRLDEAEELVERELELGAWLARQHPGLVAALDTRAAILETAARLRRARGELERSTALLQEAVELIEQALSASPDNLLLQRNACSLRNRLADNLVANGRADEALWILEESRERTEALVEADPADRQLQRDLATVLRQLGGLRLRLDDPEGAYAAFTRAGSLAREASAADGANVDLLANVALAALGEGESLVRLGRGADALPAVRRAVEQAEQVLARAPVDPARQRTVVTILVRAGDAALELAGREDVDPGLARAAARLGREHVERGLVLAGDLRAREAATALDRELEARLRAAADELRARLDAAH